jgi:hypothetical protein
LNKNDDIEKYWEKNIENMRKIIMIKKQNKLQKIIVEMY